MAKSYSRAELEALLGNPNVRKMLDLISYAEGTQANGYYTTFGGGRQSSLATHENRRKSFKQTDGKTNTSSAAGRYQFLKGTWDGLARQYGLKDFSERSQDIGALALIAQKGQLERVVAGDVKGAVSKLGSIWASFPSSTYKQGKKSWDAIDRFLGGSGTSSAPAVAQQPTYNEIPQVQTPQAPQVQQTNLDSLYAMPQVATSSVQPVGVQNLFSIGGQPVSAIAPVAPTQTSLFGGGLFSSQPVELTPTATSLFRG